MGTIKQMYDNWCLEELRWASQVNQWVWLAWFNKWLLIFQKMMLEYASWLQSTSVSFGDIAKDTDEYDLPQYDKVHNIEDFYSIVQLRVAYHKDKKGNPLYRICKPINFSDYNIRPMLNQYDEDTWKLEKQWGHQVGWPYVWGRISEINPRYIFVPKKVNGEYKNRIKIFPTPTEDIDNWLTLTYNFIQQPIKESEAFPEDDDDSIELSTLTLPRYFFDAIEDYITFRLYQAENPEQAQWYYQQFESTLHDNIYWLNKDKRPVDEWFADLRYFYHY